jgi:hypothetical protein
MFVVIEEYIEKLSRKYHVIGAYNTKEEASFLANHMLDTSGVYQNNCGYYYNCFVEEVESHLVITHNTKLYFLVKSGIYTGGVSRQTLTELCCKERADFEYVIGVFESMEEANEIFIRLNDKDGFYFCIPFFTNGLYDEEAVLF